MVSKSASPCIVWFRDDLRLSDHPALHAAAHSGDPVICVYVLDEPDIANARALGGAARWWLAQSLRALDKSLQAIGASLVLRNNYLQSQAISTTQSRAKERISEHAFVIRALERSGDLAEHIARRAARGLGAEMSARSRGLVEPKEGHRRFALRESVY